MRGARDNAATRVRHLSRVENQNMYESDWSDAGRLLNPVSDSDEEEEDNTFMNSSRYLA